MGIKQKFKLATKCWQGCGANLRHPTLLLKMQNGTISLGNSLVVSNPHKILPVHVYSSFMCNSTKLEMT